MKAFLQNKIHFSNRKNLIYLEVVSSAVITFVFLLTFEPYIFSDFEFTDQLVLGTSGSLIVLVVFTLKCLYALKMAKNGLWTIQKELITLLVVNLALTLIVVGLTPSILKGIYHHPVEVNVEFFFTVFGFVNIIGMLLFFSTVTMRYFFQISTDDKPESQEVIQEHQEKQEIVEEETVHSQLITLVGKNQGEELVIPKETLVCISTSGHYIDIFSKDKDSDRLKKVVYRNTIASVTNSLKNHEEFIQCHRSHLVNLNHVDKLVGSAKKMEVKIEDFDMMIPVSRAKISELTKRVEVPN